MGRLSSQAHALWRTGDGHHDGGKLGEVLDEGVEALQDAPRDAGRQRQQAALAVARLLPRLLRRAATQGQDRIWVLGFRVMVIG